MDDLYLVQKLSRCTAPEAERGGGLSIDGISGRCREKCLAIGVVSQPRQLNTYVAKD
jgi:hypothetical protein